MNQTHRVGILIALAFLIAFAALTKTKPESWNDMARIATIESLVERGTWAIDGSGWVELTQDKVFLNGSFYSDKLPLFSLMGAGVYAVLHNGLGASLAPNCLDTGRPCAYASLTLILVGVPVALTLWLFFALARRNGAPVTSAAIGTVALGLGTMLFPYALVFNHHAPAAASVFASYYVLNRARATGKSVIGNWLLAGSLAALAISFDALGVIVAASVFAIALARLRTRFVYFLIGAGIPLVLTALLDYQIAGTIVPAYLIPQGYAYEGSAFPAVVGSNAGTPDDYAAYAFRMFLGGKGLFAYNPLLLFALVGAVAVALKRSHPLRIAGIATASGFGLLSIFLATQTGNFGGLSYGERWFVVAIPLLFSFVFFVPPLDAPTWKNPAWMLFLPLLALSIFSSLQGAQAPWQDWLPPLQMTRSAEFPIIGFKWNVKLW